MRITLLRHGPPDFEWDQSVGGSDFKAVQESYDSADIVGIPPEEACKLISQHEIVVCSDLPRSVQSAQALGVEQIGCSSALYQEVKLPYFNHSAIRLPLKLWVVIFRILWFLGFSKNAESLSAAKSRARQASKMLVELAAKHNGVLLVGHGLLNYYIAKELLAAGWVGPGNPGRRHWEFGSYEYR